MQAEWRPFRAGVRNNSGARLTTGPGATIVSDLLTVWRRRHVEIDSMATVIGNAVGGNIT